MRRAEVELAKVRCDEHRTTPPCWSRRAGPNPSPGTPAYEQSRHRVRLGAADRAVAPAGVASLRWGGRLTLADRGKVVGVVAVVAVLVAAIPCSPPQRWAMS